MYSDSEIIKRYHELLAERLRITRRIAELDYGLFKIALVAPNLVLAALMEIGLGAEELGEEPEPVEPFDDLALQACSDLLRRISRLALRTKADESR